MPIKISLNVTRIPREKIVPGKNGKYCDFVLFAYKAGRDQYGNDGFVSMDVTKAEREAGVRGEIIGNWKDTSGGQPQRQAPRPQGGDADVVDSDF